MLGLQGLHAIKAAKETKVRMEALKTTEMELSVKVHVSEDDDMGLTDKNRRF